MERRDKHQRPRRPAVPGSEASLVRGEPRRPGFFLLAVDVIVIRPRSWLQVTNPCAVRQDAGSDSVIPHRSSETKGITTMTKIILRDEVAALLAERDLLRARLAKARHHKIGTRR